MKKVDPFEPELARRIGAEPPALTANASPPAVSALTSGRPTLDETFMKHAFVAAARSTCIRAIKYRGGGIGCVIVVNERVVSSGYCGSLRGAEHCTDVGCLTDERTGGCVRTVHAEVNAVLNAAYHGVRVEGGTAFTTVSPCWDCFKALVNAGLKRIVFAEVYRLGIDRQMEFAKTLGIQLELKEL